MTTKERTARALADTLLNGGIDLWPLAPLFTYLQCQGFSWNGAQWKMRPEAMPL